MPYRPRKTSTSTSVKTALASKLSTKPATGAWLHDSQTGETSYTADPARYEGNPRFKLLWGKRNKTAKSEIKRNPKPAKPTLYPIAGDDPLSAGQPSTTQAAMVDIRLFNSDPYFNIKQMIDEPADFNKTKMAEYRAMHWLFY